MYVHNLHLLFTVRTFNCPTRKPVFSESLLHWLYSLYCLESLLLLHYIMLVLIVLSHPLFLVMPLTSVISLFFFPLYSSCCVVLSYDTSCHSKLFLVVTSFIITICYLDSDSPLYPLQWKQVTVEGVEEFFKSVYWHNIYIVSIQKYQTQVMPFTYILTKPATCQPVYFWLLSSPVSNTDSYISLNSYKTILNGPERPK